MTLQLDPELEAGLRRLRLRGMRELAPELLATAKTQRWAPHELLATLVREEIASREASNERARLKAAGFPAAKTLEGFDIKTSKVGSVGRFLGVLAKREHRGAVVVGAGHQRPAPERCGVAYRSGSETWRQGFPVTLGRLQHRCVQPLAVVVESAAGDPAIVDLHDPRAGGHRELAGELVPGVPGRQVRVDEHPQTIGSDHLVSEAGGDDRGERFGPQ